MPRNTGLVHAHDLDEIANRPLSVADSIEDASAGWLGDGFQHVRWHGFEHMASHIYAQAYVRMTRPRETSPTARPILEPQAQDAGLGGDFRAWWCRARLATTTARSASGRLTAALPPRRAAG